MKIQKNRVALSFIAVVLALAIWAGIGYLTGGEAWNNNLFWFVGYPIEVAACGYLAYLLPRKPWFWGAVMMGSQFLYTFVENFYQASIPVLTLAVFAVMSIPCVIVGYLGAHVSKIRKTGSE
jgi:hypothetical protein